MIKIMDGFSKGLFIILIAGFLPFYLLVIKSLKKALFMLLILSLSLRLDFNPWWSDTYTEINPGVPISVTSLILISLYIIWFYDIYKRTSSISFFPQVTIPLSIIVIWSGLSFLVAIKPSFVLYEFISALECLLLFLLVANFIKSEQDITFIMKCVAITIVISGLLGCVQYISGSSLNLSLLGGKETQWVQQYDTLSLSRVTGFFSGPNGLAKYLVAWLPLLLVFSNRKLVGTRLYFISISAFVLGLICLVLTFSRGGWLAFIASILLIVLFFTKGKFRILFIRMLVKNILILILLILPLTPYLQSKISTRLFQDDKGSSYDRIPLAKTALKIIEKNPLTGVGLGNYVFVVPDFDDDPIATNSGEPLQVHNFLLHTTSELGIPTLLLFLWISLVFLYKGKQTTHSSNRIFKLFAIGLLAGLYAFFIQGMFEPNIVVSATFRPIWFIGGSLMALSKLIQIENHHNLQK